MTVDGVHTVLSLVEDLGLLRLEDLVGNFHLGDAELLGLLSTNRGVGVVESRQAVQEDGFRLGESHELSGHAMKARAP